MLSLHGFVNYKLGIILYQVLFFLFSSGWLIAQNNFENNSLPTAYYFTEQRSDSTFCRNLKFNPLQIFFNEISLSFELFKESNLENTTLFGMNESRRLTKKLTADHKKSFQIVFGFIYPSSMENSLNYKQDINYFCIKYLDDPGRSPFINTGISLKLDFRKYRNSFYFGPQLMEKFVFCSRKAIDNESGDLIGGLVRLQSEYANVIGTGYFIGSQHIKNGFVTDFYFGISGRLRLGVIKIYEETPYGGPTHYYADPGEIRITKFYPAVNMGFRIGYVL